MQPRTASPGRRLTIARTAKRSTARRPLLAVAAGAVIVAVLLTPPVFSGLLALGPLLGREIVGLWIASLTVAGLAITLAFASGRPAAVLGAVTFAVVVLVGVELGFRIVARVFLAADTTAALQRLADGTYPERMRIRPHPFLQYVGNRGANALGFSDDDPFVRAKPAGTVRIACLGGSTTAHGNWPFFLEQVLADGDTDPSRSFEVLNFAQNGYSSVHVVVNFFLNVVEYDPDFVVVHTGWNDTVYRGRGTDVSSDYSEVFKAFEYPSAFETWPVRVSALYRYVLHRWVGLPAWAEVAPAILGSVNAPGSFDDPAELAVLRRNLEKIADFCEARGIRLVLTTQPHSVDPTVDGAVQAEHIDQCNTVVRELHRERPATTLLVDLGAAMTGTYDDLFEDLGHLVREGQMIKADLVGRAILDDLDGSR